MIEMIENLFDNDLIRNMIVGVCAVDRFLRGKKDGK
jgi:hypothetical protein